MTVIVITHNSALAPMADRVIRIKNGRVESMEMNAHPVPVERLNGRETDEETSIEKRFLYGNTKELRKISLHFFIVAIGTAFFRESGQRNRICAYRETRILTKVS